MSKRILYLQITEPGAYPPLIHSSELFSEKSWKVYFLSAPIKGKNLRVNQGKNIKDIRLKERLTHVVTKWYLIYYVFASIYYVLKLRPSVIYASDPISSIPATFASLFGLIKVIYHEHDSPNSQKKLNLIVRYFRNKLCEISEIIIFPNEDRATIARKELGFNISKLRIVWNLPRKNHLKVKEEILSKELLLLYYLGSINSQRLPETLFEAVSEFKGKVELNVVGYEAPDSIGYIESMKKKYDKHEKFINFKGQINHSELYLEAQKCHVGLCFMPMESNDVNMKFMVGASNKVFEYMALGLPVIVSDLPEWISTFVDLEYAEFCDIYSKNSIAEVIQKFFTKNSCNELSAVAMNCQQKIRSDWNYESQFNNVIEELEQFELLK
jgi:glycosyltransferase involved in cell wall biosynthesis